MLPLAYEGLAGMKVLISIHYIRLDMYSYIISSQANEVRMLTLYMAWGITMVRYILVKPFKVWF